MSRTRVQQSQISGSLSVDVSDSYVAADALTRAEGGSSTLVADLNDLRKQLNRIIGEGSWSAALAGEQDLSDIYGALHVDGSDNAEFQADLSVKGNTTLGDAASDTITFTAKAATDLAMDTHKVSGLAQATAAGDALAWGQDASVSDLIVTAGDFTVDASGNVSAGGTLNVTGKADFADIVDVAGTLSASAIKIDGDVAGRLYFVDPSTLEIQDSADLVFSAGALNITGALTASLGVSVGGDLNVAGPAVFQDGVTISNGGAIIDGDRLEVTGSMGVTGEVDFDSTLNVDGAVTLGSTLNVSGQADFAGIVDVAGTLSASAVKIDGDVAQRLYIVGGDGELKDESKLTFDGSELWVDGDLEVAGGDITMSEGVAMASSVGGKLTITAADEVELSGDLDVQGGKIYLSNGATIDSDTAGVLLLTEDLVATSHDLKVGGNDILDSADATVISFKTVNGIASSVEVANNMEVKGDMFLAVSASFSGDVTVQGDLNIQGKMTYIDTENLKVQDALIHLNVAGDSLSSPRGVVFHGGQAYDDLAFGAKPNSGDFVFAKEVDDSDVDAGNSDIFASAKLAAAWMSTMQLGDREGSLSGSLSASAAGIELASAAGKELAVSAAADLLLSANGETAISFIESGEYAAFNAQFPGSSLVAAIVAAGGNFKQDSFLPGAVAANTAIDFEAALGFELRSAAVADDAAKKLAMDVYLNGVRLAYAEDYSVWSTTEIKLTMATVADDRLLIVVHNAA